MGVGPYDILLQDRETNPQIELGLVLAYNEDDARQLWSEGRIPPIPPRRSEGSLSWTHKDPIADFVFSQSNWEDGAFQPYYNDNDPNRYAKSDGIDLRWDGVIALGSRRSPIRTANTAHSKISADVFVANGGFEQGGTNSWTAGTGATLAVNTTTVQSGRYSGQITVARGTSAGNIITQDLSNPTIYRSRQITVTAYVARSSGSDSAVALRLFDGATTTSSSNVTASTLTYVSVTATIGAGISLVRLSLVTAATMTDADNVFLLDNVSVVPTGGVAWNGAAVRGVPGGTDEIYALCGRSIVKWNESTFSWEAVRIDAVNVPTDIIEFNNNIYTAFGESNSSTPRQYVYGSGTTWTTAAISSTTTHQDNHARHWVKARNGFGEWALWKAGPSTDQGTERNAVQWATDPTNSGAWSPTTPFTIGSSSRQINKLHPMRDTFMVMKSDGVWIWDVVINDFVVLTPEWENQLSTDNGLVGQVWHNDLYFNTALQGFFRFDGTNFEELSSLLMAPRFPEFGGQITAMTASARELIVALDQPVADTTVGKTSRLTRLRLSNRGRWQLHTSQEPDIAVIDVLTFHLGSRLWALGRTYDANLEDYVVAANVWLEPDKVAAPYANVTPYIESTGTFDTSIWHGGIPDTPKAAIALTIWGEDLDTNHTVQVSMGRDGRAPSTIDVGTFSGTGRVQTLFFKDITNPAIDAVGLTFQLRFTLATTDTVSPKIFSFMLHTQLVPEPIRVFNLDVWVGGETILNTGVPHELGKSEIESVFKELETQIFPITMIENLGNGAGGEGDNGAHVRLVRLRNFDRVPVDDGSIIGDGQERWRLVLQEVAITDASLIT